MKVIVVEDQLLFRDFLVNLLKDRLSMEVVGVASDGETALELVLRTEPDLVILDILIPKLSGILVARAILEKHPATRILGISSETDVKTLHQVDKLRLAGFIDKNEATVDVLVEAIESIRRNKRYFSHSLTSAIRKLKADPLSFQKILSKREQEILTFIGGGLSDGEIGRRLGLSETSIQSHRRNLFRKLDIHSTPELIRFANEAGFWKGSFSKMGLSESYHMHE